MAIVLSFLFLSFILTSCGNTKKTDDLSFYEIKTEKPETCEYILHVKYKIKGIKDGNKTYYFPRLIQSKEIYLPKIDSEICINKDDAGYSFSQAISNVTNTGLIFEINAKTINNRNKTPYLKENFYIQYNVNKIVKSNNYQIDFIWESPSFSPSKEHD
jgi:hypothetical protein